MRGFGGRSTRWWVAGVAAVVAFLGATACEPSPSPRTPMRFSFDEATLPYGTAQGSFANRGSSALHAVAVRADGGTITTADGRGSATSNRAIRFPHFDSTAPAPRAVVKVTNAGSGDGLDPGSARFEFGADFVLDATSADVGSSSIDDGDNLVQRGRYDQTTQYKLEIDHRQPICRVKGRSGEVTVFAGTKVQAGRWYRARCVRDGTKVTVLVTWWNADGTTTTQGWSKTHATGSMRPSSASVPVSLGGKLLGNAVDPDADQFNGYLDNTYLIIG